MAGKGLAVLGTARVCPPVRAAGSPRWTTMSSSSSARPDGRCASPRRWTVSPHTRRPRSPPRSPRRHGAGRRALGGGLRELRARLRPGAAACRPDAGVPARAAPRLRGLRRRSRPGRAGRARGRLGTLRPRWSATDHAAAFERAAEYIRAGDVYQVNLTLPLDGRWQGDPAAIGATLAARQPVGFGARVALGEAVLLSRSPELFFALDGTGGIEARPMKGTAPRDADPARDAALAAALARDRRTAPRT